MLTYLESGSELEVHQERCDGRPHIVNVSAVHKVQYKLIQHDAPADELRGVIQDEIVVW